MREADTTMFHVHNSSMTMPLLIQQSHGKKKWFKYVEIQRKWIDGNPLKHPIAALRPGETHVVLMDFLSVQNCIDPHSTSVWVDGKAIDRWLVSSCSTQTVYDSGFLVKVWANLNKQWEL